MLSYEEYALLAEQAPIMIWRSDPSGGCDYFNERWLAFRGRTLEQELGNGWAEGVHPDDLSRCLEIYLGAFRRREIFEMEYRLQRSDGVYRWIFDRGVPYYTMAGQFCGFIGSCVDVTERIEAEAALREARENELNNLRRLLHICAVCKKIHSRDGGWQPLETYISEHSGADFSHGLCPDCVDKMK
jgi:PAS domain S-box-containing protein